jgi:beta-N-acetylhexosaminidase
VNALDSIGQMFMVDFSGLEPSSGLERLIADEGIGGVILFDKNIAVPHQVARLANALQQIAAAAGRPPLLIGIDQEGGPVARLRTGATHFPSGMAFGAAASEALAAAAAGITARELRAVGIHMNMAPVLDVNNNPDNPVIGIRSYGEDPALVARLGAATIRSMQAAGVLATAKHFPGHGDTVLDSHLALPVVAHDRVRLERVELAPFQAAIRAGVGAVMTAHVVYPALDPDRPATLSPAILSSLLRERLGFAGLVVTDSMAMRAVADHFSAGGAAVMAVLAGADIVLALGPEEAQRDALGAVRRAAGDGRLPAGLIAASGARIAGAKRRLGLPERALVAVDAVHSRVGTPEHLAVAAHVAEAAATLVRDPRHVVPLAPGPVAVVAGAEAAGADVAGAALLLTRALHAEGRDAAVVRADRLGAAGPGAVFVIVLNGRAAGEAETAAGAARVVGAALSRGPTAAVAAGAPYVAAALPQDAACIAVYGADPASLQAAARVLAGVRPPRGHLPVSLPAAPG